MNEPLAPPASVNAGRRCRASMPARGDDQGFNGILSRGPGSGCLHPEFVAALAALGDVDEELIERHAPLDRSLFMGVADQDLEL